MLKTFIRSYKSLKELDYTMIFTDFYLLSRMFMSFDGTPKKVIRSPKRCKIKGNENYSIPQYLIVYAGDAHIQDIIQFFKLMFRAKPIYTTGEVSRLSKKINLKDIYNRNNNETTIDDLFSDFYE